MPHPTVYELGISNRNVKNWQENTWWWQVISGPHIDWHRLVMFECHDFTGVCSLNLWIYVLRWVTWQQYRCLRWAMSVLFTVHTRCDTTALGTVARWLCTIYYVTLQGIISACLQQLWILSFFFFFYIWDGKMMPMDASNHISLTFRHVRRRHDNVGINQNFTRQNVWSKNIMIWYKCRDTDFCDATWVANHV